LRFQAARKNVKLYGFINGLKGLMEEKIVEINEESFKPFRNLGGYDYLGRSHDYLRTSAEQLQAAKVCKQ
jgi:6-phosphofructokinase